MGAVAGTVLLDPVAEPVPATLRSSLLLSVRRMNQALAHRGPDDAEVHEAGRVVLGHRCLSILSAVGGRQPIVSADGSVLLVCDGEIYNHRELSALLGGRGHHFRTHGDMEAILHGYAEWGVEVLPRLRGNFALALYDRGRQVLLLCRDAVGEKPLYYHLGLLPVSGQARPEQPRVLSFASEAKGLLALPWVERRADPQGIADYLRYRYVMAPHTALAGIAKLPAGTYLRIDLAVPGQKLPEPVPYWHLSYRPKLQAGRRLLECIVEEFLEEAVLSRMQADVPAGVLLSGGLASTLLLCLMRRQAGVQKVASFHAGLGPSGSESEEGPRAAHAARVMHARHHEVLVRGDSLVLLPRVLWHLDEPLCHPALLSTFCVAELAAAQVQAALTGAGALSVLGGHERHRRSLVGRMLRGLPRGPRDLVLRALHGVPELSASWTERLTREGKTAEVPLGLLYQQSVTAFTHAEVRALLHDMPLPATALSGDRVAALYESADAEHPLDRFLFTDLRSYVADNLLMQTDRMTMAHGLQARTPLLDISFLAVAATLPASVKCPPFHGATVLERLAERILPDPLRPLARKQRVPPSASLPPLYRWLRQGLSGDGRPGPALLHSTLVEAGVLDAQALGGMMRPAAGTDTGMEERRLMLWLLELWHRVVVLEQRDAHRMVAA